MQLCRARRWVARLVRYARSVASDGFALLFERFNLMASWHRQSNRIDAESASQLTIVPVYAIEDGVTMRLTACQEEERDYSEQISRASVRGVCPQLDGHER